MFRFLRCPYSILILTVTIWAGCITSESRTEGDDDDIDAGGDTDSDSDTDSDTETETDTDTDTETDTETETDTNTDTFTDTDTWTDTGTDTYTDTWTDTGYGTGECEPAATINCGDTVAGANNADGSTNQITQYTGCGGGTDGPEFVYTFESPGTGAITITLSGMTDDLDLFLLEDLLSMGCNSEYCLGYSAMGGNSDEIVIYNVFEGSTYYIPVDGWAGSISAYTINLECDFGGIDAGPDSGN